MKPGDIFEFANNRIRILMLDTNEVFYDTVNQEGMFDFAKKKTVIYNRTSRDFFEKKSRFISSIELSSSEKEIHRPDLPLRLNCFKNIFWSTEIFNNILKFEEYLNITGFKLDIFQGIKTNKLYIVPTSQQNSNKTPVLIENSEVEFSAIELLYHCFNIQRDFLRKEKPYFSQFRLIPNGREEKRLTGIGIYRLGIIGNIPSYYIGGEISNMELVSSDVYLVSKV